MALDPGASIESIQRVDVKGNIAELPWKWESSWTWGPWASTPWSPSPHPSASPSPLAAPTPTASPNPAVTSTPVVSPATAVTTDPLRPPIHPVPRVHFHLEPQEELTFSGPDAPLKDSTGGFVLKRPNGPSDAHWKKDRDTALSLVFVGDRQSHGVLIHPTCQSQGLSIVTKATANELAKPPLFLGLYCIIRAYELDVYVFTPEDALSIGSKPSPPVFSLPTGERAKGDGWTLYRYPVPSGGWPKRMTLLSLKRGNKHELHVVREASKKFAFKVWAGATAMRYTESPFGIEISELAVTFKLSVAYPILQDRLNLQASAFFGALPFQLTSSGYSTARFYGVNGRVEYQLPWRASKFSFKVSPGVYFWGMIVPGGEYGISSLLGPSITMSALYSGETVPHPWNFYFKYSPFIWSSGQEIAFGGGYQLNRATEAHPITLDADIASAVSPPTARVINGMTLRSGSLSVGYGF